MKNLVIFFGVTPEGNKAVDRALEGAPKPMTTDEEWLEQLLKDLVDSYDASRTTTNPSYTVELVQGAILGHFAQREKEARKSEVQNILDYEVPDVTQEELKIASKIMYARARLASLRSEGKDSE